MDSPENAPSPAAVPPNPDPNPTGARSPTPTSRPTTIAVVAPRHPPEMRFGSYPLFVLFWPLVVGGELCAWLLHWKGEWAANLTWVYVTTMLVCFTAVGFDVRRNLAIGWLLFVALCWVAGIYLRDAKQIPVLSHIRQFLASLDATVSPGFLHAVALLVGIGLVGVLANVALNHRWRVTHNELQAYRRGEMEDAITRGAKRISVEFPDVFELLLLGAGHVVVRDSKGKEEIRRIPRVPLLFFRRRQLEKIAEVWGVASSSETASGDDEG